MPENRTTRFCIGDRVIVDDGYDTLATVVALDLKPEFPVANLGFQSWTCAVSETLTSRYIVRSWGPLHHRWWKTEPYKDAMVEETWHLGPFELIRSYVASDPKYGSWHATFTVSLRRWYGPWFHIGFGSGAQDWDKDDEFWKERDDD